MELYILQLLHDKGIPDDLDQEVHDQLIHDLTDRAVNLINKRMIEAVPEDQLPALEQLITEHPDDAERFQQFLSAHVPDQQEIATRALVEFRALYLGADA